jgi:2-polyprenyl-6-hydroxyphenyl methylase/3-demethylubiquinone-9 3-methyltransferase
MPADNSLYNTFANGWWDENHFLHMLKTGINLARVSYFREVFARRNTQPGSLKVLDIGCGGGILSEEFALMGCDVSGVDISLASIRTAAEHASSGHLDIHYYVGSAQALPIRSESFDVVVCCDVLEHLRELETALSEASRALKTGGLYFFDTINRTRQSFIENIVIAQQFPLTRFFAPGTHDWNQFIQPEELATCLKNHGIELQEITGLQPGIPPADTARELFRLKLKWINFTELGQRLKFRYGGSTESSYAGFGIKI